MRPRTAWHLGILGFALAAMLLAIVGWTSYRRLIDLREASRSVEHTLEVSAETETALSLLTDAETGQRGFLITGEAAYLTPYQTAVTSLPQHLDRLRRLTADNPRQHENIGALDALSRRKLDELNATIAARKSGGVEATSRIVRTDEGKQVMDRIRAVGAAMRDEEKQLLSKRSALRAREARAATSTTLESLVLGFGLVVAATVLLNRAVRERDREQASRTSAERMAAALALSEERLRVTIASIGDAVIATDDQGAVTLLNPVAEALTGWTASDAAKRPLQEVFVIIDETTRRPAENPVEKVLGEGIVTGLANHTVLVSRDGREIPVDDSAAPIKSADGRVVGAVIVFRDVSGRRQTERERAALFERERRARAEAEHLNHRLRHVQAVTDVALSSLGLNDLLPQLLARVRLALGSDTATVLLLEPDGSHLATAAADGLREQRREDIRLPRGQGVAWRIAASVDGLVFDDLAAVDVVSPFLREAIKSLIGAPLRIGERLIGVIHVGAVAPRRFTNEDLELLRLVAERAALAVERARLHEAEQTARVGAEIAERRASFLAEASQLLSSSLDYEATLANVARLAVPRLADLCAVDMVEASGMARRLAVVHVDPAKETLARELRERYPFEPGARTGVPKVLRTGESEFLPDVSDALLERRATDPEELRLFRAIGIGSAIITPLRARRKVLGAITFVRGVSGRRYDAADFALAQDLALRAGLAIDHARLFREGEALLIRARQARQEAEAANRTKDDFLAILSHELRTPLTSIVGWARMLRGAALDETMRVRALDVIERSAKLQAKVVDDLLDVTRFMRGDMRLDFHPLDLTKIIVAAVDAVRATADDKGIVLDRNLGAAPELIAGDSARLQQIVMNLLTNAIKFTPKGGRVTVRLEHADSWARIVVTDTGKGISASFLPHVFEIFRQGEGARQHGGLGLGLAIVSRLVELHGGTVRAESAGDGQGATFTVTLPVLGSAPAG